MYVSLLCLLQGFLHGLLILLVKYRRVRGFSGFGGLFRLICFRFRRAYGLSQYSKHSLSIIEHVCVEMGNSLVARMVYLFHLLLIQVKQEIEDQELYSAGRNLGAAKTIHDEVKMFEGYDLKELLQICK